MQREPEFLLPESELLAGLHDTPSTRRIRRLLPEVEQADPWAAVVFGLALCAIVVAASLA